MGFRGAVAQLGERRVRNAKVGGSNPLGSTTHPIHPEARGDSAPMLMGWR